MGGKAKGKHSSKMEIIFGLFKGRVSVNLESGFKEGMLTVWSLYLRRDKHGP